MKKTFNKHNLMPVIVLSVICIIVAALLGFINTFTSKKIEEQMLKETNAAKIEVLDGLDVNSAEEITLDSGKYPSSVKAITKFDIGYVVETEVKGNAAGMVVLVGINNDGAVTGVKVIANGETPSFWEKAEPELTGENGRYNGKTAETLELELVSGASYSSGGVYDAVKASLDSFVVLNGGEVETEPEYTPPVSQRTDEELVSLARGLVTDSTGFDFAEYDAKEYGLKYLAKVLKDKSGKGYVAYLVVINERYNRVETETLVHVGNDGSIKNVSKLVWKTSDAGWGYEPPEESLVEAFYASLVGKNLAELEELAALADLGEGEHGGLLVTGATTTSKSLVTSIIEGAKVIADLVIKDMPTPEEEIIELSQKMVGEGAEFTNVTPDETTFVKRIYRENKGMGYIAYLVVINERYNRVETETLVYVGNDGKIKGINKLIWKTSDAGWGFEPPEESLVEAFYASLVGKNLAELEELAALADLGEGEHGGLLVTGATTTSKALLVALGEGVGAIDDIRKKDMPRPEDEVVSLAQQMAGEGSVLTNVTPGGVEFLKRLYRIDNTNNYIAYLVVINERYNRVETETMIYIGDDGELKNIKKLTWKTSDAGWGYEPPEESLVEAFYASLVGKNLAELEALVDLADLGEGEHGGLLVTGATTTSKALLVSVIEAFESASAINLEIPEKVNNIPKIVGITAISLIVLAIAAYIAVPKIISKRRRKNG